MSMFSKKLSELRAILDNPDGKVSVVEALKKYGAVNHTDKKTPPPADKKQPELPMNYLPKQKEWIVHSISMYRES